MGSVGERPGLGGRTRARTGCRRSLRRVNRRLPCEPQLRAPQRLLAGGDVPAEVPPAHISSTRENSGSSARSLISSIHTLRRSSAMLAASCRRTGPTLVPATFGRCVKLRRIACIRVCSQCDRTSCRSGFGSGRGRGLRHCDPDPAARSCPTRTGTVRSWPFPRTAFRRRTPG